MVLLRVERPAVLGVGEVRLKVVGELLHVRREGGVLATGARWEVPALLHLHVHVVAVHAGLPPSESRPKIEAQGGSTEAGRRERVGGREHGVGFGQRRAVRDAVEWEAACEPDKRISPVSDTASSGTSATCPILLWREERSNADRVAQHLVS